MKKTCVIAMCHSPVGKGRSTKCVEHVYTCSYGTCERMAKDARGNGMRYCPMHTQRLKRGVDMDKPPKNTEPQWIVDNNGYVQKEIRIKGRRKKIAQHREVMERVLGRPLLPGEEVHHKNGVRHDNRAENLELWVVSQPAGQRPEDLVAWAKEILDRYDR